MKSTSTDPRAQRTRELLRSALMTAVIEKPFRDLTIRDITDAAGVNRATFYLHYEDKYDLLGDCGQVLFQEIRDAIQVASIFDPNEIGENAIEKHKLRMLIVLQHFRTHVAFYKAMLRDDGDPLFHNLFRNSASNWIKQQIKNVFKIRNITVDEDLIDMMVRFQSAGNFDVISWWLENDMRIPIDLMAERLAVVTVPPLVRMLTDNTLNT